MPRRDLVIVPDDQPGVLARLGEAAADAGVNIEALSAFTGGGKGVVHVLVDNHEKALTAFNEAGFDVRAARRVCVAPLDIEPGSMGRAARALADAGINVEQAYIAANNQFVVVTDDVDGAKAALGIA
ncbi:MAG: hypothetical protein ACI9AD_001616 [Nitriliruptoraceae bacterium]|jgi:hypothetical protein